MSFEFMGLNGLEAVYVRSWNSIVWTHAHTAAEIQNLSNGPSAIAQLRGASVLFFNVFEERKCVGFSTVS